MAGSYPDAPSRRIAYDADGTVGVYITTDSNWDFYGTPAEMTAANLAELNDEDETVVFGWTSALDPRRLLAFVFPELRDIYGWFSSTTAGQVALEGSANTTNGLDGDWSDLVSDLTDSVSTSPYYRTAVNTFDSTTLFPSGLRAVRAQQAVNDANVKAIHMYGEITSGSTPDRLLYIDNSTGLEYTGPVDWGDIPRGAVYDEDFYVKNNSSTLDAINSTLNLEALYGDSVSYYTLSTGVGWSTSLGPYATIQTSSQWPTTASSPNYLTVRCDPPSTATLGLHSARIVLATSSWS